MNVDYKYFLSFYSIYWYNLISLIQLVNVTEVEVKFLLTNFLIHSLEIGNKSETDHKDTNKVAVQLAGSTT